MSIVPHWPWSGADVSFATPSPEIEAYELPSVNNAPAPRRRAMRSLTTRDIQTPCSRRVADLI
jgi:hypothetical protein